MGQGLERISLLADGVIDGLETRAMVLATMRAPISSSMSSRMRLSPSATMPPAISRRMRLAPVSGAPRAFRRPGCRARPDPRRAGSSSLDEVEEILAGEGRVVPLAQLGDLLEQDANLVVNLDLRADLFLGDFLARQAFQILLEVENLAQVEVARAILVAQARCVEDFGRLEEGANGLADFLDAVAGVEGVDLVERVVELVAFLEGP